MFDGLQTGLHNIALLSDAETRSISAENPNGERAGGAKGRARCKQRGLAAWVRVGRCGPKSSSPRNQPPHWPKSRGRAPFSTSGSPCAPRRTAARSCAATGTVRRLASVEVPLGDFFCNGHALRYDVNSLPIAVNPVGRFQLLLADALPPQRAHHHRERVLGRDSGLLLSDYVRTWPRCRKMPPISTPSGGRSMTTREYPEHVLLDGVSGQGQYVGTFIAWSQFSNGWWGEGEVKFYMDGDTDHPTICGTGTEDYFGGAWNFGDRDVLHALPWLSALQAKTRTKCRSTACTAGTSWTPFASSRT